jgi:alpha-beta hydrolase superfamily lysophospholipase
MKANRIQLLFLGLLLSGLAITWLAGSHLIAPHQAAIRTPGDLPLRTIALQANGRKVEGWLVPGTARGTILLLHGIRGDRRHMLDRARFLHKTGYTVLLIDLPGHGNSPAPAMTFGLTEGAAVQAALEWLRSTYPGQPLGLIGTSLGAASYVLCRGCPTVDAAVLEMMYPTIEEALHDRLHMRVGPLAHLLAPLLLWQLPLRLSIDPAQLRPIDRIGELSAPTFVVAGDRDLHTTIAETRRIYRTVRAPKQLWVVAGAGHEDLYRFAQPEYEARVAAFLAARFARASR